MTVATLEITRTDAVDILRKMYRIRHFEGKVIDLFQEGQIRGSTHTYIGMEGSGVGACSALRPDDYITSTHRGHGHCIAKGGRVDLMMAELLGKATGYCKGKGGSMHIADVDAGILGANGIVGGGIGIATGAGLSSKLKGSGQVCVCFFGDGGFNQGVFYECANIAAIWKLPVIYLCENNKYAMSTPVHYATAVADLSARAAAFGIPGVNVDGMDAIAMREAVYFAAERGRRGDGPTLIVADTYRYEGHNVGDGQRYRTRDEVDQWRQNDPIQRFRETIARHGILAEHDADEVEREVEAELQQAIQFAMESPEPTADTLETDVYSAAAPEGSTASAPTEGRELTISQALNQALREEMARDERVFLLGEEIARWGAGGGIFGVTLNLVKEFGEERVLDTPISEEAIAGIATGAAVTGTRPVGEIMYVDFTALAMDAIVNQAAKLRYMFGGKVNVPMVLRAQEGAGRGNAAQHSQSLEAWFTHVPGLKVAVPSTPYDAKGLLKTAIRDENPVIFLEHKALYATKGPVPEAEYAIPFGVADVKRAGEHVTVVAIHTMVHRALAAAEKLAAEGISVEVIDPRTLVPLDIDTIVASVKKTKRLVVAHEAVERSGFAGEIAMQVVDRAFDYLDAPIKRVCGRNVPIPYNLALERLAIPQEEDVIVAIREVVRGAL